MEPFTTLTSGAVPFGRANIDTDQIIPARFLSRPRSMDHAQFLFHDARRTPEGEQRLDFPINRLHWRDARILLGGRNFACGSSRESAVWSLFDHGIRAVIAPSFGDIFANNAVKNGVLAVVLPKAAVDTLMAEAETMPGAPVTIDLPAQSVTSASGETWHFDIDPYAKKSLLEGLDELAFTLTHGDEIAAFERRMGRDNR